jgi:hypothetical protein
MTEARLDLNWRLFADPPDEPETQYGAMLVNYSGNTARDTYDMVTSYPETAKIGETITKLLGSINGAALALAELSNIPNMRHGGSLDWGTLQRQHALMLGGLCDSLVAFLFDVAWSRTTPECAPIRCWSSAMVATRASGQ